MVHSYGSNKRDALELNEHIYEFFPVGIRASNKVYFDVHRYKDANTMEDASITFSVIPVKGTFDVKFLQCYTDIGQCLKDTKTPEMKSYKTR